MSLETGPRPTTRETPSRRSRPAVTGAQPAVRRVPTSTYRLQLHAGFTADDAAEIVPYLARLGVGHLFCSPVLQAAPGSTHGYDVVDHTRISDVISSLISLRISTFTDTPFSSISASVSTSGISIVSNSRLMSGIASRCIDRYSYSRHVTSASSAA